MLNERMSNWQFLSDRIISKVPGPYIIAEYNEYNQRILNEKEIKDISSDLKNNKYHKKKYNSILILPEWLLNNEKPKELFVTIDTYEIENLYLKLSKIDTANYNDIIKFYNKYGLLESQLLEKISLKYGGIVDFVLSSQLLYYKDPSFRTIKFIKDSFLVEKFTDFVEEVNQIRLLTYLWFYITNNKNDLLNELISDIESNLTADITRTGLMPLYEEKIHKSNDPYIYVKIYLLDKINQKLSSINPVLKLGKNDEFLPGYRISTLLGTVYQQFYDLLSERKKLLKCKECGSLFPPPTDAYHREYCPAPGGGRSPCENSFNTRKQRYFIKLFNGEVTPEEAAKGIRVSVNELKKLLLEYKPRNKNNEESLSEYIKTANWL